MGPASNAVPTVPSTKRKLLVLSHAMERALDTARPAGTTTGRVLGLFQRREYYDVERLRYAELAAAGHTVIVAFAGSTRDLPGGVHAVGFAEDDPRALDWVLVTVREAYATSWVAQDIKALAPGEPTLESSRVFESRWTFRRDRAPADGRNSWPGWPPTSRAT